MRFASANFYVGNPRPRTDARLLNELNLDSIGFQEIWRHKGIVDSVMKNHKFYSSRKSNSDAAQEVAVAVHERNEVTGWRAAEVSDLERGEETPIFKSRWITVVLYKHRGKKYAHLNYHGNAVVQDRRNGKLLERAERVKEWLEAAQEIQRTIKSLKKRGYIVLVTGDFNYRRYRVASFVLAYWSPQRIFKRCGLEWVENGLDYIAWSKSERKVKQIIIPTKRTGADHAWLIVELA